MEKLLNTLGSLEVHEQLYVDLKMLRAFPSEQSKSLRARSPRQGRVIDSLLSAGDEHTELTDEV